MDKCPKCGTVCCGLINGKCYKCGYTLPKPTYFIDLDFLDFEELFDD